MTSETGDTPPCPAPSRFWEVAGGDSWRARERLHIASCPQCQAAERAIGHVVGRAVEEPEPTGWKNEETLEDVEQNSVDRPVPDSVSVSEASVTGIGLRVDSQSTRSHAPNALLASQAWMADSIADPADTVGSYPSAGSTRPLDLGVSTAGSWSDVPATFGDYQIIQRIGTGGMGVVFKVRDVALDRIVAIKIIREFGSVHDDRMNRLFREARISASLKHPSIAQIYNIGQVNGMPYIVSEFVEGKSFSEYARPHGRLAPNDLAGIIARVADAIHYAHSLGIVHRDVKPSNILIDQELWPHLIDFGLARSWVDSAEATLSHAGQIVGTPSYMSPEQAEGRLDAVGPATDVYSLGATLYALLTGEAPFPGPDVFETMQLLRTAEPVPPRRLNPTVPRDLETVCLTAMARDPRKRYATARDMADDLRRFQSGSPISARAPGAWAHVTRFCRRHRLVFLMAFLAVTASAVGASAALLAIRYGRIGPLSGNAPVAALDGENRRVLRLAVNRSAEAELRRAVQAGDATVRAQPDRHDSLQSLAGAYHRLGDLFVNTDRLPEAEWAYERAVKHLRRCIQLEAGDARSQKELADVLSNSSETARALGETNHARELGREAEVVRRHLGADHANSDSN